MTCTVFKGEMGPENKEKLDYSDGRFRDTAAK
jgi:hypothetical protein